MGWTTNVVLFGMLFSCNLLSSALGNPEYYDTDLHSHRSRHSRVREQGRWLAKYLNCTPQTYSLDFVVIQENNLFISNENTTIRFTNYKIIGRKVYICPAPVPVPSKVSHPCKYGKFSYFSSGWEIFRNGSALFRGRIIPREEYDVQGNIFKTCMPLHVDLVDLSQPPPKESDILITINRIGSGISVTALILHQLTFCCLPNLKSVAGYNLVSLSYALLIAHSFVLIGQMPSVGGLLCVISANLQQNFFMTAYFCTNVLAYDVWRTLNAFAKKIIQGSMTTRKRRFWYFLYSWESPLLITLISVVVDNAKSLPDSIKPYYGKYNTDICWMNNKIARIIFLFAPAAILLWINVFLFVKSARLLPTNTRKSVKHNYVLYVILNSEMGITWLIGLFAFASDNENATIAFHVLNSLQGLILLLLFLFTQRVYHEIKERIAYKNEFEEHIRLSKNTFNFDIRPEFHPNLPKIPEVVGQ